MKVEEPIVELFKKSKRNSWMKLDDTEEGRIESFVVSRSLQRLRTVLKNAFEDLFEEFLDIWTETKLPLLDLQITILQLLYYLQIIIFYYSL